MEILNYFKHLTLSNDQQIAIEKLQAFLQSDKRVFILKGYAGSGKTTLLKGLIDYLQSINRENHLMAPTGRAAKVINLKTKYPATTIHKGIYSFDELKEIKRGEQKNDLSFLYEYKLRNNLEVHNDVFIVDEASMLSDVLNQGEFFRFGSGYLMRDLIHFSRILDKSLDSKIIFIGDPAQLPPIKMNFSPALDSSYLLEKYKLKAEIVVMRQVKRQDTENAVLKAATEFRRCLTSGYFNTFNLTSNNKDIFNPKYENYLNVYNNINEQKIIICYKNKTALDINTDIRKLKYGKNLPIQVSDVVIIGSNNYKLGIMNGEFAVVSKSAEETKSRIIPVYYNGQKHSVKLVWRKISLIIPDENNEPKNIDGYMLENFLTGDNWLNSPEQKALYIDFKIRHPKLKKGTKEFKEAIKKDSYFNCILLKYGYAVTCHKAQGGEWPNVFVFWDKGTQPGFDFHINSKSTRGKTNQDFYRWAYTAITRTSNKLYCINTPYFHPFHEMNFIPSNAQESFEELTGANIKKEINFSEVAPVLEKFELIEAPLTLQNHFIERWYNLRKYYIDIKSWARKGYEIWYQFKRDNDTAGVKYWINGKNEFSNKYQKIPRLTSSDKLFDEIISILKNPFQIEVARNNAEGIISQLEFDIAIEEEKPFLKTLYVHLLNNLEEKDAIKEINHLPFRERYTFTSNGLDCVVDFEYKKSGFFGRVLPLEKHCHNPKLLTRIENIVNNLKNN